MRIKAKSVVIGNEVRLTNGLTARVLDSVATPSAQRIVFQFTSKITGARPWAEHYPFDHELTLVPVTLHR